MRKILWIIPLLCLLIIPKVAKADFTFVWDETIPVNGTYGYMLDDYMRQFNTSIRERLAIEHYFLNSDTTTTDSVGYHKQISFIDQTTPDTEAYGGRLYTKTNNGVSTLYFLTNTGSNVQLTAGSSTTYNVNTQGLLKDCFNGDTGVLNPVVNITGFNTNGDGGGGLFYWDDTEPKVNHNGGTIIDPTHSDTYISDTVVTDTVWTDTSWWVAENTGVGCWKRQFDGTFNVKMFGAKGNGVMDDTYPINFTIQAAYDCALSDTTIFDSGFSTVRIPAGQYHINANRNLSIYSDLQGISLLSGINLVMDQNTFLEAIACDSAYYSVINISNRYDSSITGGNIIGDRLIHNGPPTGEQGHGINIAGSQNVIISGVKISYCWGDGIIVTPSARTYLPSAVNSSNITIRDCISNFNRRQGLSATGVEGLRVLNNTFSSTARTVTVTPMNGDATYSDTGTDPKAGIDLEPDQIAYVVSGVLISENRFYNNGGAGVTMNTAVDTLLYDVRVQGNTFTSNMNAIEANDGSHIIISGNIISGDKPSSTILHANYRGILVQTPGVVIESNVLNYNLTEGIQLVTGADTCLVQNNMVCNNGGFGMLINDVNNNTITGNIVTDNCRTDTAAFANIYLTGTISPSRYNNVQMNKTGVGVNSVKPLYGIYVGGSNNLITNNDCRMGGSSMGIYNADVNNYGSGNLLNDGTWGDTG